MASPELALGSAIGLLAGGLAAGACNAVAGGGTLFSFPMFIACGLPPVVANASNAVAVWPGHALASIGYRQELSSFTRGLLPASAIAVVGGGIGAYLLALVGNAAFSKLIPLLLAAATALFAFAPVASKRLARLPPRAAGASHIGPLALLGIFLSSLYGGFFGAGLGVMLMAGLLLAGVNDPQRNNALKNLLATGVTSVAVVVLAVSDLIAWPHTAVAFIGALAGGLWGSRLARSLPPALLRRIIILVGTSLSLYFACTLYVPYIL